MTYEVKTTNPCPALGGEDFPALNRPETPRRRRTVKNPEAMLDRELDLSRAERSQALARIRRAAQPIRETKRIIEQRRKLALGDVGRRDGNVDLSDLQELVAKVLRRDGLVSPLQSTMLKRLGRQIAQGSLTAAQYRANAAILLAMVPALPKKFRVAESSYLQE